MKCGEFLHFHNHISLALTASSVLQGATDSEKRVLCLSAENESLKQNLSLTQGLLQQLSTIPSQSSTMLIKVRHAVAAWELTGIPCCQVRRCRYK